MRPPRCLELEHRTEQGEAESQEKRRQRGHLIAVCSWLMGEGRKGGARLLLEVHRDRMTGNGHKLEQEKIPT